MPPGAQFIILLATLENISGTPVTLREIEPARVEAMPESARVVKIELVVLDPTRGRAVDLGRWTTYPPTGVPAGAERCVVAEVESVRAYRLGPDQATVAILTWIRAVRPGEFVMDGYRVQYEQDGVVYEQNVPLRITGTVDASAPPIESHADELACAREVGDRSRLLN